MSIKSIRTQNFMRNSTLVNIWGKTVVAHVPAYIKLFSYFNFFHFKKIVIIN